MTFPTLNHWLKDICEKSADREFLIAVDEQGTDCNFTYGQFFESSECVASRLEEAGLKKGDTAILILPQDAELLFSIIGCVQRGIIPTVLAFPNFKFDSERYKIQLNHLVTYLDARWIMSSKKLPEQIDKLIREIVAARPGTTYARIEEIDLGGRPSVKFNLDARSEDVAFLQHSSGTTGLQKGVAITHRSAIQQITHYSGAMRITPEDGVASWLPLYHDMGLLACFWLPLLARIPLVQMAPAYWVVQPQELLIRMHRHRSTLAWLPNFAFTFLAHRVNDDLLPSNFSMANIRAFVNCSEPVLEKSFTDFEERFRKFGVRPGMLQASYAMAENTFAVTQTRIAEPPLTDHVKRDPFQRDNQAIEAAGGEPALSFVSSGRAIGGTNIRIVDAAGAVLPDRLIGEIAVSGDSLMGGYYKREDFTREAVRDGWYYTGDVGYLAGGELYVIGRAKDLIIIGGKNIYPQDVETIVSEYPGVHPGRVVAVGIFNENIGTEDLCVAAELEQKDGLNEAEIRRGIKKSITDALDIAARHVFFVPPRWIVKSTSGKVSRKQNREKTIAEFLSKGRG